MKLFSFILVSLMFNQSTPLVEQSDINVYLYDMDSYVHGLSPPKRYGFASDPAQIERNLMTILSMNFVYDYIVDNNLENEDTFVKAKAAVQKLELDIDSDFVDTLDIDISEFEKDLKHFLLKKEYFARMRYWFKNDAQINLVDSMAKDYFIVNKKQYATPESRRIQMITLDKGVTSIPKITEYLKSLISGANFGKLAKDVSTDKSVSLNNGDLGLFSEKQFKYPFAKDVFTAGLGVIPSVFSFKDKQYIVSVAEIIPSKPALYEKYEEEIKEELVSNIVKQKMQGIINSYALADKVTPNPEALQMIMQRYLVFKKDI